MIPMVFWASLPPARASRAKPGRTAAKGVVDRQRVEADEYPRHRQHQHQRQAKAEQGGKHDGRARDAESGPDDRAGAGLHHPGAGKPADQGMRAARRNAEPPGQQIPADGAHEGAEYDRRVDDLGGDDSRPDGLRDVQPEHHEGDEIEERRPRHGILRRQHPGRHHRCNRVGGIMQPVQEVERQRDRNQGDEYASAVSIALAPSQSTFRVNGKPPRHFDDDRADLVGDPRTDPRRSRGDRKPRSRS